MLDPLVVESIIYIYAYYDMLIIYEYYTINAFITPFTQRSVAAVPVTSPDDRCQSSPLGSLGPGWWNPPAAEVVAGFVPARNDIKVTPVIHIYIYVYILGAYISLYGKFII